MTRAGVDERIYSAALELLRTRGPGAVSVESVAAHSGVAKTTIYRRFENRDDLLIAAVRSATQPVDLPDGLSVEDTLRWALRHAHHTIDTVVGRGALAALVAGSEPHLRGMIRTSINPLRDKLNDAVAAGELRPDLDTELVLSVLMGAVIAEIIRARPTDDDWVESVLALLWPGLSRS